MDKPNEIVTPPKVKTMTFSDILFLCFMVFVVFAVAFVGRLAYLEGMKTEGSKQNGEAMAAWFTQASADRFNDNFNPTECAAGLLPALPAISPMASATEMSATAPTPASDAASADSATTGASVESPKNVSASTTATQETKGSEASAQNVARTWGDCLRYLTSEKGPWSKMTNPFNGEALSFIDKCDPTNHDIPGFIVLESINPTPPGSAVASYANALASTDAIDKKMLLRVTICDKGSYPIPIADLEF
jgi:nitrate reductase NapE component